MVEASEDPSVVIARQEREMRAARETSAAAKMLTPSPSSVQPPGELADSTAAIAIEPPARTVGVSAEEAFRRGRLGAVAAISLVLILVWIRQRRNAAR